MYTSVKNMLVYTSTACVHQCVHTEPLSPYHHKKPKLVCTNVAYGHLSFLHGHIANVSIPISMPLVLGVCDMFCILFQKAVQNEPSKT